MLFRNGTRKLLSELFVKNTFVKLRDLYHSFHSPCNFFAFFFHRERKLILFKRVIYKDCDIRGPKIKLIHMNTQSARNKIDDLIILLDEASFKFDIIVLTKT